MSGNPSERGDKSQHEPGKTDLAGIADRIRHYREVLSGDAIGFDMLLYWHESIDVEEALRKASTAAAHGLDDHDEPLRELCFQLPERESRSRRELLPADRAVGPHERCSLCRR